MRNPFKIWRQAGPAAFGLILVIALLTCGSADSQPTTKSAAFGLAAQAQTLRTRRAALFRARAARYRTAKASQGKAAEAESKSGNEAEAKKEVGESHDDGQAESTAKSVQESTQDTSPDGSKPMRRRPLAGQARQGGGGARPAAGRPGQGPAANLQQRLREEVLRRVGLTPEQQARMENIRQSHQDEVIAAGRRVRVARRNMNQAMMAEHFDETEFNKYLEELGNAQKAQVMLLARIRAEQRLVLTPEQLTRLKTLQQQFQQNMRQQQRIDLQMQEPAAPPRPPDNAERDQSTPAPDLIDLLLGPSNPPDSRPR